MLKTWNCMQEVSSLPLLQRAYLCHQNQLDNHCMNRDNDLQCKQNSLPLYFIIYINFVGHLVAINSKNAYIYVQLGHKTFFKLPQKYAPYIIFASYPILVFVFKIKFLHKLT